MVSGNICNNSDSRFDVNSAIPDWKEEHHESTEVVNRIPKL